MKNLTFFPIPYPSELLYYTICRYNKMMDETETTTNRRLFNKINLSLKPFFMDNYPLFSSLFLKSKEHILEEHTPYRFFVPFCQDEDINRIKRACFENDSNAHFKYLTNCLDYKNLRYCPVCAKMEQNDYSEPYISTFHCLPNVPFCIYHKCLLIPIAPEKFQWRFGYLTIDNNDIPDQGLRPIELIPIMERIAPLIEEQFSDPYKQFNYRIQDFTGRIHTLLLKNGYIYTKAEYLDYTKLKNDLFKTYNLHMPNVLSIMNLKETDFINVSLVNSRCYHKKLLPIVYLLVVGLFCDSMKDFYNIKPYNFTKRKVGFREYKPLDEGEKLKRIILKDNNMYDEILQANKKISEIYDPKPMITKKILLSHTEHYKSCYDLDNLPKSKALIDSLIDNPDDYKYEKIRSAAFILIDKGRKVSNSNIRKIAGLRLSENTIKKLWLRVIEEFSEFTYDGYEKRSKK